MISWGNIRLDTFLLPGLPLPWLPWLPPLLHPLFPQLLPMRLFPLISIPPTPFIEISIPFPGCSLHGGLGLTISGVGSGRGALVVSGLGLGV